MRARSANFLKQLLFTLLFFGALIGLYLYAGQQERLSAAASPTAAAGAVGFSARPAATPPPSAMPSPASSDVLSALAAAGLSASAPDKDGWRALSSDADGAPAGSLLFETNADGTMRLVFRLPLPALPDRVNPDSAIEQWLFQRYDAALATLSATAQRMLSAAIRAFTGEAPSKERLATLADCAAQCAQGALPRFTAPDPPLSMAQAVSGEAAYLEITVG